MRKEKHRYLYLTSIILTGGLHVLLDPYPQGRLVHWLYEANNYTYPSRDTVIKISDRG